MDLVVVSYHSDADLAQFVWSYVACKPTDLETRLLIFFVEATPEEIAGAALLPSTELCWSPKNVGYNRACNAGADILAGNPSDVLALFNRSQCKVCGRRWTRVRTGGDEIDNSYYKYELSPVTRRQSTRWAMKGAVGPAMRSGLDNPVKGYMISSWLLTPTTELSRIGWRRT